MAVNVFALLVNFLLLAQRANGQKGIGSLNDPCDCMQHHDYWVQTRAMVTQVFWSDNFEIRLFDPTDGLNRWVQKQSCMYSPENEEAHRPVALSDCIPGFLLVHVVCMQKSLVESQIGKVISHATELARLLPWGINCLEAADWPLKPKHVRRYYRRVRRTFALYKEKENGGKEVPLHILQAMAWSAPKPDEGDHVQDLLGEEAEVCPMLSLPDVGVCWVLGPVGKGCEDACIASGMSFRPPLSLPTEPIVPKIIGMVDSIHPDLKIQIEWAPYECYVSGEHRFHLAQFQDDMPHNWSYPICELACPCAVAAPQSIIDALKTVPYLHDIEIR